MTLRPELREALTRVLVEFIGRHAGSGWADQYKPLRAAEAEQFFTLTELVTEFIDGKRDYVRFRGKREGENLQRPVLEIRRVAGLDYVYVVVSMSHQYIVLTPETHELELEVNAAIEGPRRFISQLPIKLRKLAEQPILVHDQRRSDAVWYQAERYVYLCVIPGPGPLAQRISIYDSWSSTTGQPESIDVGGIPSPAMLDYYTRGVLELEADAPTMPG